MSDINGIDVSDVLGLSKPLTKLIEVVSAGIGKAYEPSNIRRLAHAEADKIAILGDAMTQNPQVAINYSDGTAMIIDSATQQLLLRTQGRLAFQELKKQQNIEGVIKCAYQQIEQEQEVSATTVDPDWISRFFGVIEDVSHEQMQRLWGKILAGEIKRPQSFSLRTLDVLRNLTQHEAEIFTNISQYAFYSDEQILLPGESEFLKYCKISSRDIQVLVEAGLLSPSEKVISSSSNQKDNVIQTGNYAIIYDVIPGTFKTHSLPYLISSFYGYTHSGTELCRLLNQFPSLDVVIFFCRQHINPKYWENIRVYKVNMQNSNGVDCDETVNFYSE